MVDSSRPGEAHQPRLGERGELACQVVLVVSVWWERHRGSGDVWRAAGETSKRIRGCEIPCIRHKSNDEECPVKESRISQSCSPLHRPHGLVVSSHNDGRAPASEMDSSGSRTCG